MKSFNDTLGEYIEIINRALFRYIPKTKAGYSYICEAMKYSLEAGGKRIRPVLVLEFCRLCGGDVKAALPFACAVEYIHTYSLIHDDLPCMDDDDLRRGRPSSHIKFGEANALLAGDALLTLAFGVLCEAENEAAVCRTVKILAKRAGVLGMIGGQYLDLAGEGKALATAELEELDGLKTCALISAACELGCIVAGANEKELAAAKEFAYNLGMAFQITDDILDATGSTEDLGKPAGSDAGKGKSTYFGVLGEFAARKKAEMFTRRALEALGSFKGDTDFLAGLTKKLIDRKF